MDMSLCILLRPERRLKWLGSFMIRLSIIVDCLLFRVLLSDRRVTCRNIGELLVIFYYYLAHRMNSNICLDKYQKRKDKSLHSPLVLRGSKLVPGIMKTSVCTGYSRL